MLVYAGEKSPIISNLIRVTWSLNTYVSYDHIFKRAHNPGKKSDLCTNKGSEMYCIVCICAIMGVLLMGFKKETTYRQVTAKFNANLMRTQCVECTVFSQTLSVS